MINSRIIILTLLLGIVSTGITSCSKENKENINKNNIEITSITPVSPAELVFGEFVLIQYDFQIDHPSGALMWIQPYTNGKITPEFLYSTSSIYYGMGSREVKISVKSGDKPVVVDQLRIVMKDQDQEKTLFESFMNVNFTFK